MGPKKAKKGNFKII